MKLRPKGITLVIAAALCIGIGTVIGRVMSGGGNDDEVITVDSTLNTVMLEAIMKPAGELVSLKYCYTDADVYETSKMAFGKVIPFTTDKVVFTYSGTINAGIDISQVVYEIDNGSKVIEVKLPEPQILSHEMDESGFKFYDVKNSVFTETTLGDYNSLMSDLKSRKEEFVRADEEFFSSVTDNAQDVIKSFLTLSESTKDYRVVFE